MKRLTLDKLIDDINALPPIPSLVVHVLDLLNDSESDIRMISEQLACDPALTASILAVCNSGYYSVRQEISSIQQAITYLGRTTIKRILITTLVARYYQDLPRGYEAYPGQLWEHCMAVALFSELLGENNDMQDLDTLFTVGLLHDVGKLILNSYLHKEYQEVLRIMQEDPRPFSEVEEEFFGFTHGEAGAHLLTKWRMPAIFIDVARYHSNPHPDHPIEVHIVAASNILARSMGLGTDIYITSKTSDHPLLQEVDSKPGAIDDLIARFQPSFTRICDIYNSATR
ncbi:HDOD domain-containing protein [Desulfurispira natronophila]|uniref:Putative nucleotidyltransferase with HDIG domain n=1 Tax=Desulfurispira natronophila TaxID=682562 RepID=A0A7W8DG05_9BACT|nr:HDOD domain-containing protein [Desulfurispira natronophila]MBB5020895.1 putative nucleotidyltransferase with HDIG domain [Desulfurispira natronophila]